MHSFALPVVSLLAAAMQDGELHPRCSWAREGASVVFDGLSSCGSDEHLVDAATASFRRHEYLHGWNLHLAQDERCPGHVLDLMTSLAMPCNRDSIDDLHVQVAEVLEHNGRVDEALAVLDAAFESLKSSPDAWRAWELFELNMLPKVARAAAQICERAGRYELALHYASEWVPTSSCGIGIAGERGDIDVFKARCLVRARRWDEARSLCIQNLRNSWGRDSCIVESWIDASIAMGEANDPGVAVAQLEAFLDTNEVSDLDVGADHWHALNVPPEAQLAEISAFTWPHHDVANALVAKLGDADLVRMCSAFDVNNGVLKDSWIAERLARTGTHVVGDAIAQASSQPMNPKMRERFESIRETWNSVHNQLLVLRSQ